MVIFKLSQPGLFVTSSVHATRIPSSYGRYTAIVPALPVDGSLAASHPAIAAFQPWNLQTIFSPPKQDVDHASIQQQFSMLNETVVRLEQKVIKHDQEILLLNE